MGDPRPPAREGRDDRSRHRTRIVQMVVLALIAVVSAVQVGMTLFTDDPATWRTAVQGFLVVAAPIAASSLWAQHRGG